MLLIVKKDYASIDKLMKQIFYLFLLNILLNIFLNKISKKKCFLEG